jgi:hypothetical protein
LCVVDFEVLWPAVWDVPDVPIGFAFPWPELDADGPASASDPEIRTIPKVAMSVLMSDLLFAAGAG